MENVKFLGVEIVFEGKTTNGDLEQGFGAITLSCDGREYILDVVNSYWFDKIGETLVECNIEEDREIFSECKYDLTVDDLFDPNLKATIFIGDFSNELISATLFIKSGNCTKAINLELE